MIFQFICAIIYNIGYNIGRRQSSDYPSAGRSGVFMKEVLYEESANPVNLKFQKVIFIIYTVLIWFFGILDFIVILYFTSAWLSIIFLTLSGVGFLRRKIYYCVDLVFVTGQTRIIKVIHYKFRKKMMVFDYNEVIQVGKVGSESFEKLYAMPKLKKIYATPNKYISEGYYVYLAQDGVNQLVILECKEDYLINLVNFAGRKIIEKDYK